MKCGRTTSQLLAEVDRATLAHVVVSSDPAYSSWPNQFRQNILDDHQYYLKLWDIALGPDVERLPEPEPAVRKYNIPRHALTQIALLLCKAPTKIVLRDLDVAAMDASLEIIDYAKRKGITVREACVLQFDSASESWYMNSAYRGKSFPSVAVASEVSVAQRFGWSDKKPRRKAVGSVTPTYNQKKALKK